MAEPRIVYLDPSTRVAQAEQRVRELRRQRFEIEQDLMAAEAVWDIERRRETPGSTEQLLTIPEAAKRISVSESMLWKAVRAGRLGVTRVGRATRISVPQLQDFVEGQRA